MKTANHTKSESLSHTEPRSLELLDILLDQAKKPLHGTAPFEPLTEGSPRDVSLPDSDARFRALADSAPVLIWMADPNQSCEYFNKGWLDFTGRDLNQELGSGWTASLFSEDRERVLSAYRGAFAQRERFEIEYRLLRKDGEFRWLLAAGVPHFSPTGKFVGYIGSCVDITDHKHAQLKLQQLLTASKEAHSLLAEQTRQLHLLAESDPLTGVLNRRSFRERLEREWSRSKRHEHALACVMLDIDFFKKINDTHGHAAGDAVLKRVAEVLLEQCRPSDLVCRYGGEEFCIALAETSETGAVTLAERLRLAIMNTRIEFNGQTLGVTSSFGVSERVGDVENPEELIERADHALHIAKHSGRNRVMGYVSDETTSDAVTIGNPTRILEDVTALDLLTPTPCIEENKTIEDAVDFLVWHGIGSAPVVDMEGKLIGFISERDLMTQNVSRESWSRSIREVMKTNVVCYEENTPGQQIFQFLSRVSIHRVVVAKNGLPLGVISPISLLSFFQQQVANRPDTSTTLP